MMSQREPILDPSHPRYFILTLQPFLSPSESAEATTKHPFNVPNCAWVVLLFSSAGWKQRAFSCFGTNHSEKYRLTFKLFYVRNSGVFEMATIQLCSLVFSRLSAFQSQQGQGPRPRSKAKECWDLLADLHTALIYVFCLRNLRNAKKSQKNTHPWLAPWRSRRTLRRCFLLFTQRFSPRTVGISVLAHPTQNLFAQILPIIPPAPHHTTPHRATRLTETLQRQKKKRKRDKTRFALITLSHAVSSKVSAAHSTNNDVQQTEKARRYWISIKPSRRTAFLAGIVYHPLKTPPWMEMRGG